MDRVADREAEPSTRGPSTFREWLEQRVAADGRSARALGPAAGVSYKTVADLLAGRVARPSETTARRLAEQLGSDADAIAALAGYGAAQRSGPDPRRFDDVRDWLRAALEERGVSAGAASRAAGLSANTIHQMLRTDYMPERPTLDKLAAYFNVDPADLRALRPKDPERVARGKRIAEQLGAAGMTELAARGREAVARLPAETRVAKDRKAGVTRLRRWAEKGGHPLNNGEWVRCVFCDDAERLIYRTPSSAARGEAKYHRECFHEWTRTPEMREQRRVTGTLGRIRQRVRQTGDGALLSRVDGQIRAELRRLKDPNASGRPPTLLENRGLAVEMARLQHEGGMSAAEVAELADFAPRRDANGKPKANSTAMDLLRLGRALLGLDRLKPGPRAS